MLGGQSWEGHCLWYSRIANVQSGRDRHSVASSGLCRRGTLASIQFFRTTLGRLIVILN